MARRSRFAAHHKVILRLPHSVEQVCEGEYGIVFDEFPWRILASWYDTRLALSDNAHYDFSAGWAVFSANTSYVMEWFEPLLVYTVVLIAFVLSQLVLAQYAGPRKKTSVKHMPYESGMDPVGDARQPFDVKFYLVAILFLLFDVELLFLFPWAVSAYVASGAVEVNISPAIRGTVFAVMLVFMATLAIAYVYAWRKGVFRWR